MLLASVQLLPYFRTLTELFKAQRDPSGDEEQFSARELLYKPEHQFPTCAKEH